MMREQFFADVMDWGNGTVAIVYVDRDQDSVRPGLRGNKQSVVD